MFSTPLKWLANAVQSIHSMSNAIDSDNNNNNNNIVIDNNDKGSNDIVVDDNNNNIAVEQNDVNANANSIIHVLEMD